MNAPKRPRGRPRLGAAALPPASEEDWPDDLIVVNCARCARVLRSRRNRVPGFEHLPRVFARVYGRPVCGACYPRAAAEPKPPETLFSTPNPE